MKVCKNGLWMIEFGKMTWSGKGDQRFLPWPAVMFVGCQSTDRALKAWNRSRSFGLIDTPRTADFVHDRSDLYVLSDAFAWVWEHADPDVVMSSSSDATPPLHRADKGTFSSNPVGSVDKSILQVNIGGFKHSPGDFAYLYLSINHDVFIHTRSSVLSREDGWFRCGMIQQRGYRWKRV